MGPFIKDKNNTNKIMMHLIIALTPIIIFAFVKNGIIPYKRGYTNSIGLFYPLILMVIPTTLLTILELIFGLIKNNKIKEKTSLTYAIFSGIVLGIITPINTPILTTIIGTIISFVIIKILFIIFGKNILNPATIFGILLATIFVTQITTKGGYLNPYEFKTLDSSLTNAQITGVIANYDTLVKPYGRLINIFIGNTPGTLGETSTLLCIIALIYLILFKVIKWKIPITYILTVFAITYVIGGTNDLGIWYPIFQILTGGILFKAIFIASDNKTSPVTPIGQILYGMFLGILTVIFRFLIPFPESIIASILIMNIFVTLLDKIGSQARFNFKITIIPFIIAWILIITLSIGISKNYNKKETININTKKIDYQQTLK